VTLPRRTDPDAGWHDWVAIRRAVGGEPIGRPLTYRELNLAVDTLRGRGERCGDIDRKCELQHGETQRFLDARHKRRRQRRKREAARAA